MIVTKEQLRRIIQETVRRKLDLGPDEWIPGPAVELTEGRLTKDQLQQLIDEEFHGAMTRREQIEAPPAPRSGLYECDVNELLEFARAYARLPLTVREQLDDLNDNPLTEVTSRAANLLNESLGGLNEELDQVIQCAYGMEEESMQDKQQKMHYDLDHDGEIGEPKAHREKVLGHGHDMDEDDAPSDAPVSSPPSGGQSSSPPSSTSPTQPSGGSTPPPADEMKLGLDEDDLDQVTPPGREKQVKALKKKGNVDNPWAVAWASYNKSHHKKKK